MNKYDDPENVEDILQTINRLDNIRDIIVYVESIYPDWIVGYMPCYSDNYSHFNRNWQLICDKIGCQQTDIMIVEENFIDGDSSNNRVIRYLSELFTRAGFSVRKKREFIPCSVCGKALPSMILWNLLREKAPHLSGEKWSDKCDGCI